MSETFDLLIRGGTLVTAESVVQADIGISGGTIVQLETGLSGSAAEILDAEGLHIFPGLIDSHVHFNDPGRAHWEGVATGSRACAAGGGTLYFDMPLNSSPPTLDAESFDKKLAATQGQSVIDFAFWGGLTPNNLEHLEELAARGVVGFKAFMANSGIEDFGCADERTLREGMKQASQLRKLVAVHAESEQMTAALAQAAIARGQTGIRDYLDSRPIQAEVEAIERALALAGETGCPLHIVHVSSGAGVASVAAAQQRGVDVTCETCPHYLTLTEEDVLRLGAVAKCAPPLRAANTPGELWRCLQDGQIRTVGSDHSPSPPEMKSDANFFAVWGGVSGVQHTLPLLLTEGFAERNTALPLLARTTSENVAKRFGITERKGALEIGKDADLALIDLADAFQVREQELLYRHRQSPYVGRKLRGRVRHTLLRGKRVFEDGRFIGNPSGQFIAPTAAPGRFN